MGRTLTFITLYILNHCFYIYVKALRYDYKKNTHKSYSYAMYNSSYKITQLLLEQSDNTFNFINEVILLLYKVQIKSILGFTYQVL